MRLLAKWTQHLEANQKDNFYRDWQAAKPVLERLTSIIEEFERELTDSELSIEEYNSPAYPYLKADRTGERRALRKIKQLINTKE